MRIKSIKARQILNGSGHPTVEIEVATSRNFAISSVPLASTKSKFEFNDIYDNHTKRYHKETLNVIVENVANVVAPELIGKNSMDQENIDKLLLQLDGTYNRSRLGVNVLTAISQAVAKLGALESELPLFKYIRVLYDFTGISKDKLNSSYKMPTPVLTIYKHFSTHSKGVMPFQEIMVITKPNFKFLRDLIPTYEKLNNLDLDSIDSFNSSSLNQIIENIQEKFKNNKIDIEFAIDFASSRFYRNDENIYVIPNFLSHGSTFKGNGQKMMSVFKRLHENNVHYLEDPFAEDDYSSWKILTDYSSTHHIHLDVVADDLTATNIERLTKVSMLGATNHVSVKPTQIGTLSETINFIQLAKDLGMEVTISYRNGETEDTFISDLACGVNADYIRTGYFLGSEYISKLNRLTQIEHLLN